MTHLPRLAGPMVLLILTGLCCLGTLGQGYWIDEVISADTAALPWPELLSRTGFGDVHPPLYYGLLKIWHGVAGPSDLAGRLLSLILAMGTVSLLVLWAQSRAGQPVALGAGFVMATSTFHAHYAVEVRSYVLLAFLCLATLVAYESWRQGPHDRRRARVYGVLASLTLWTHYYGLLWVGLLALHFVLGARQAPRAHSSWRRIHFGILAAFSPWLPLLLVQTLHLPGAMTAHLHGGLPAAALARVFGPATLHPWSWIAVGAGALVLVVGLWGCLADRDPWRDEGQEASPLSQEAASWIPSLALLLVGPLVAMFAFALSATTFDVLISVLPLTYGVLAVAMAGVVTAPWWGGRLPWPAPPLTATMLVAGAGILVLVGLVQPVWTLRNLLIFLPLIAYGLAARITAWPKGAWVASLVLWVVLAVPSLMHLAGPRLDAGLEAGAARPGTLSLLGPRDDYPAVARHLGEGPYGVFVIPRWDVPGLTRYLPPSRPVDGLLSPGDMPHGAGLPAEIHVVLTREAAAGAGRYLEAVGLHLGAAYEQTSRQRFRGIKGVVVARYTRRTDAAR